MKTEEIFFNGIIHPASKEVFHNLEDYLKWYIPDEKPEDFFWVGILTHKNDPDKGNMRIETELVRAFEEKGIKAILVFNFSSSENKNKFMSLDKLFLKYYHTSEKLLIEGLVNLQMLLGLDAGKGTLFDQGVEIYSQMDIPVFRPLVSHMQTEEQWKANVGGLSTEISWAFTTNEMLGMIEPVIIGCRDPEKEPFGTRPVVSRMERFAGRVANWIRLRNTPNHEKKLAIMIHSAPCSGVEATIGLGAGLDVFESVVRIMEALKNEGYRIDKLPENGKELYDVIMEKKAYQDFRWTTVEAIVEAGGSIHMMPLKGDDGYLRFYNGLDEDLQRQLDETWGDVPGEGMVHEGEIIITGVEFGNVVLMIQPKRGCYGAKCTGEVCKILHDPSCPPPHQYIATYRYIENIMKAHGVVHVGTGGSLEYLPGKTNALSSQCWPDVVLGNLPNFYVYNAAIGVEGTVVKRRNQGVIIDHMPSCFPVDHQRMKMLQLATKYLEALETDSNQVEILKDALEDAIGKDPAAKDVMKAYSLFEEGAVVLKGLLVQSINNSREQKRHVFGENLSKQDMKAYIKESIEGSSPQAREIKKACEDGITYQEGMLEYIDSCIERDAEKGFEGLVPSEKVEALGEQILQTYEVLRRDNPEIGSLIQALQGSYVQPGLAGIPGDDLREILPTGRNLYLMNIKKVPTREAYCAGMQLAEQVIERYMDEEGVIPEKIAMNMISTDISMTKGEQLSQVLHLMGIIPVWSESGAVEGLKAISLEELNRQRIDVTVRITGVLRDSYPQAVDLMDQAVVLASSLPESTEDNYVKKHTLAIAKELKEANVREDIERRSTVRIFGDKPGTYGAGVDLALKASAWNQGTDIAKVFTAFSGYAYGQGLNGRMAAQEFVENVKHADVSYEKTSSKRYDILASAFAASVQGGFESVKKGLSGKSLKQYHGRVEDKEKAITSAMGEEIERTLEETFFSPLWKENMKSRGYHGASEFMRRMQTVFDWQCLTDHIEDAKLDKMVEGYIADEEMVIWFNQHNAYAMEEMARRFLELHERKRWDPDPLVLEKLRKSYVQIEGDMEGLLEDEDGEFQGGAIEVLTHRDVQGWGEKMKDYEELFSSETELG